MTEKLKRTKKATAQTHVPRISHEQTHISFLYIFIYRLNGTFEITVDKHKHINTCRCKYINMRNMLKNSNCFCLHFYVAM